MKKIYKISLFVLLFFSCKEKNESVTEIEEETEEGIYVSTSGYKDGTYCAEVDYYYSETGTSSTYTLEIEIEDNELIIIYWPNGGWLDDSHFTPPDITSGEASFTSDVGVDYTVRVIGEKGDCYLNSYAEDEDDLIEANEKRKRDIEEEEEYYRQEETRIKQEEEERQKEEEDIQQEDY